MSAVMQPEPQPAAPGALARFFDGDVWHSFRSSPVAVGAAVVAAVCIFCAMFAGWISPHNPFDLATLELSDSMLPSRYLMSAPNACWATQPSKS